MLTAAAKDPALLVFAASMFGWSVELVGNFAGFPNELERSWMLASIVFRTASMETSACTRSDVPMVNTSGRARLACKFVSGICDPAAAAKTLFKSFDNKSVKKVTATPACCVTMHVR